MPPGLDKHRVTDSAGWLAFSSGTIKSACSSAPMFATDDQTGFIEEFSTISTSSVLP